VYIDLLNKSNGEQKMSLSITPTANKFTSVDLEFNGVTIRFNTQNFDRSNVNNPTRSMEPLNRYFASLSDDDQQEVFAVYGEIRESLDSVRSRERLTSKLKSHIARLYDTIDVDKMFNWLGMHLDISAGEVNENYSADDGPRELTYIRAEYKGLVRLGMVLKPLLPVIGEYMATIAKDVGTAYKEYRAMDLIDPRILARDEWQRLKVYVEVNSSYSRKTTSAVYGALSTEELPEWLLAFAVIRKVLLIDPGDTGEHIVRKMYNYLKSKMDQMDKSFDRVGDKHRPTDNAREEDNLSIMENTRVRQEISKRVPRDIEHYIMNHWREMAERLQPDIDMKLVKRCIDNISKSNIVVNEVHYMICGNIVSRVFSSTAQYHITHNPMCHVLGISQAILHTRGFPILANLCSALFIARDPDEFSLGGEGHVKSRVSRNDLDTLSEIYPHYRRSSAKQLSAKNNVGNDWIDDLLNKVNSVDIEFNLPLALDGENLSGTRMIVPSNFRPECARFLMDLDIFYRQ
jgi:hypothetical protein